jgi:hypothetical protein
MLDFTTNLAAVQAALARVEAKFVPGVLARLRKLDYAASAQGALASALRPEEEKFAGPILAGFLVEPMDLGYGLRLGAPPDMADRARAAARSLRFGGRPAKTAEGRAEQEKKFAELRHDLKAMRDLVQLWVATPATDRQDPESGKLRDERDAGLTDEEVGSRLEYILGLRTEHGRFVDDSVKAQRDARRQRKNQTPLQAARASLGRALETFYEATFGEASGLTAARFAALCAVVRAAWLGLIRAELGSAAHASLQAAVKGG